MEFGFQLHEDLLVDHDHSMKTYEELLTRVPTLAMCMSCGSCTGTCVAALRTGNGFRNFLVILQNGSRRDLEQALKYCQLCGKCWLVCPRGVNTRKAILEMKTLLQNKPGPDAWGTEKQPSAGSNIRRTG